MTQLGHSIRQIDARPTRFGGSFRGAASRRASALEQDGILTIRGEKKVEKDAGNRTFSERYYGRFERQISLDRDIDESTINATFRNGILTVTAPKSALAVERTKRIPINAAAKSH
jgi:HSP20 family protein